MVKKASKKSSPAAEGKKSTLARQINLKTMFGSLKGVDLSQGEKQLGTIAGVAIAVEFGDGDYGRWARLIGNFAAIHGQTGEIIEATKCILPGAQGEAMCDRYAAQLREDATASCKFKGVLWAVPRADYAEEGADDFGRYDLEFRLDVAPEYTNPALELLNA